MKTSHTPDRVCKCGDLDCHKTGRAGHYVPSQHTPGPFIAVKCDKNDQEPHAWKICTNAIDRRQQVAQVVYAERNARFFAHAANCHEDLLALAQEVVLQMSSSQARMNPQAQDALEQMARAAIAKAEGKP
jgi:hypothetical protein